MTYCQNLNPADLLPGNDERESALRLSQGQLATAQGKVKEAESKVNNLTDSIATTDNVAVRRTLEQRLSSVLTEQAEYEAEAKRLGQEIERQSKAEEETTTCLESLRELLAFMREDAGEDRQAIDA